MAIIVTVAALAAILVQLVIASPLMDTLLQIPELSTYAEVYNLTGGIVEINPLFLKRYNYDEDKRNYTFLAPTNDAWAKIPDAIFDVLMTQQAYPLTEALLRTHIPIGCLYLSDKTCIHDKDGILFLGDCDIEPRNVASYCNRTAEIQTRKGIAITVKPAILPH